MFHESICILIYKLFYLNLRETSDIYIYINNCYTCSYKKNELNNILKFNISKPT
jgi:hypothetical protein